MTRQMIRNYANELIGHNLLHHKKLASIFSTCQLHFTPPPEIHPDVGLALLALVIRKMAGQDTAASTKMKR